MRKILNLVLIAIFLVSFNTGIASASYDNNLRAFGVDSIAGYPVTLTTSKTLPNKDLFFKVKKPDGFFINVPAISDINGVATVDLYDYHTKKAGVYEVSAYFNDGLSQNLQTSFFTIKPDLISVEKSSVSSERTVLKTDGSDSTIINVKLQDKFGNPFKNHFVKLISSRNDDVIESLNVDNLSNDFGVSTFKIYSKTPGTSVFSAIDLTSGVILDSRVEIAFLNNSSYLSDVGGNVQYFIPLASAQEAGQLYKFKISGILDNIDPNTNLSFSVTAQDQNGLTVQNYTGSIHFSVEGKNSLNVSLPEDYTFKAEDLGVHQFSLGLKFPETGDYKLIVTDISNTSVKGEFDVTVGDKNLSGSTLSGTNVVISSPIAGSYSNNILSISGTAPSSSTLKIFDNAESIGEVKADNLGKFSFQTDKLDDGSHNIYVSLVDSSGVSISNSDVIVIIIDTTAPQIEDFVVEPKSGIESLDVINVMLITDEKLSTSALIFNLDIFDLSEDSNRDGVYNSSFQAPEVAGEYPIDVLLIDELGNEATYYNIATLTIAEGGKGSIDEDSTLKDNGEGKGEVESLESSNQPPSQVFGVIAYGSDKRVTLVWEASNDDNMVKFYRIYYGTDPLDLSSLVETIDASTTWYIPDLDNGKEYYFALSAVDDEGLESLFSSELVSAIPFTLEVEDAISDRPEKELLDDEEAYLRGAAIEDIAPDEIVKNGPEFIYLILGSVLVTLFYKRFRFVLIK